MTPKEEYEARKAARKAEREQPQSYKNRDDADFNTVLDVLDRTATSIEMVADALRPEPQMVDEAAFREQHAQGFWERAFLAALPAILQIGGNDTTIKNDVKLACAAADTAKEAWSARFA